MYRDARSTKHKIPNSNFLPNTTMVTVVLNFNNSYNQRHICSTPVRYHILTTGFSTVPANNDNTSLARQYNFRHLLVVLRIHRTIFRDVPTSEGVHSVSVILISVSVSQYNNNNNNNNNNNTQQYCLLGTGVAQWLRHCATSRTVSGSIPGGVTGDFFPWLPTEPCALGSTQPLQMSTRDFSWGKGGRCVRLTTYYRCSAERQENPGP